MTMNEPVSTAIQQGVAVIQIDNPPVNALTAGVPDALLNAVRGAERDRGVRAIVVICAGRTFIAGADIHELEHAAWDETAPLPELHPLLSAIEDCSKPVVMAVHGTALGGGVEVAMAGHYRIASANARLGLPETNLGIIPGAEGTQRLPRLIGVEKAIEMIVSGKPIGAPDAFRAGLVDRVVDPVEGDHGSAFRESAVAFALEVAGRDEPVPRARERRDRLGTLESSAALLAAGRELAGKTRRNQTAPITAIEAIAAAVSLPFDEGCARERELSRQCVRSEQCKALIHVFFAERGVSRAPDVPKDAASPAVARVAIIGAGTMGGGIAMACANAGLEVILTDAAAPAIDRGLSAIRRNYDSSVKSGRLAAAAVAERLERIRGQVGYDGIESADLVIEAVFENLTLKRQVFTDLDAIVKPGAVMATNTSTLDIDAIASATRRPASVIGLHFFSPANVMRLVEIVRGSATGPQIVATALALAKRLGKVGVVVGNGPGFVGNRMMFPYMYEAQFLVEDGATPAEVDRVLTDWGMAMGIFAVDDMAGLDVAWRVRQELRQFEDPELRKPLLSERLCELGRFGQKTGKGWFRYDGGRTPIPDPEVLELMEAVSRDAGIRRRAFSPAEILERTIFALINEGARALEQGIALRAADIDVIYTNGYGFPSYRGGPMFFADRVGLRTVCERVTSLFHELGERWEPAPLLVKLSARGMTFRDYDAGGEPTTAQVQV
jgi:3-hydroxyacyl-CoA dehydrogenase